jgi:hypothetical protein
MSHNNSALAKELEQIVTAGLEQVAIPYQKGNSIRLRHIAIRKHKNGYKLFDCKTNGHVVTTFTKTAAMAIAKHLVETPFNSYEQIVILDDKVAKHYMDALFAKRSYENTNNIDKKENAEILFDIAMDKAWSALEAIETFIFDK